MRGTAKSYTLMLNFADLISDYSPVQLSVNTVPASLIHLFSVTKKLTDWDYFCEVVHDSINLTKRLTAPH